MRGEAFTEKTSVLSLKWNRYLIFGESLVLANSVSPPRILTKNLGAFENTGGRWEKQGKY